MVEGEAEGQRTSPGMPEDDRRPDAHPRQALGDGIALHRGTGRLAARQPVAPAEARAIEGDDPEPLRGQPPPDPLHRIGGVGRSAVQQHDRPARRRFRSGLDRGQAAAADLDERSFRGMLGRNAGGDDQGRRRTRAEDGAHERGDQAEQAREGEDHDLHRSRPFTSGARRSIASFSLGMRG